MTGKVLGYPLAVFLVALVMDGASPLITQAQYLGHSGAGVRAMGVEVDIRSSVPPPMRLTPQSDSAGRGKLAYVAGGMVVGALAGAFLASSFRSDFCGEPSAGVTCSSTSTGEGLVIGAAVGALVGWIAWSSTQPAQPRPLSAHR